MAIKYLLPCECGQRVTVDKSQSGLKTPCKCGASLNVPSLSGLAKLETIEEAGEPQARKWGPKQGMIFVGSLITVVSLTATGLWYHYARPIHPYDRIGFYDLPADMTPAQALKMFNEIKKKGLEEAPAPALQDYRRQRGAHTMLSIVGLVAGGIGIAIIVAAFVTPPGARTPGPPR